MALRALLLLPMLSVPSVQPRSLMRGTFLQLWPSHFDLTPMQWRDRLRQTYRLGCRDLVVQWAGMQGGALPWQASDTMLTTLLDQASESGLSVQVGMPYDERWWTLLAQADNDALSDYLDHIGSQGAAFMDAAPWSRHAAFKGWYIPYELEQFNWASSERLALLLPWLEKLAWASNSVPGISTYYSRLPGAGSLTMIWNAILDNVQVRPMLQDGVGVAGLANFNALTPLLDMLRTRRTTFDLIVELFEERPSARSDGTTFAAVAGEFSRVHRQLRLASLSGAKRVLGFAVDPWLLGESAEARLLQQAWMRTFS